MPDYYSNGYFEVELSGADLSLKGRFTSVSGLGMEVDYEVYHEGGSNYPRFFLKEINPQILVLEQGVITDSDSAAVLMGMVNSGKCVPMKGVVTMKDHLGNPVRSWSILGAHLKRYIGPVFNSNQPVLAITRLELIYNGCY